VKGFDEVTTADAGYLGQAGLRCSVLGPLSVRRDGVPLPLGPLKQRLVLAALLVRPNTPVSVDALVDTLWESAPPRTARKNIQVYASALRRLLGPGLPGDDGVHAGGDGDGERLRHGPGGYVLRLDARESDALRFEALAQEGRRAAHTGRAASAARRLRAALDLWREPPLAELTAVSPALLAAAERLRDRRLAVYESWAEAELECGGAPAVADSVAELVAGHPLRERLRAVQITALHRCGRRAEALAAYDELRQGLSRELGLSPSSALDALHRAVLRDGAPGRAAPASSTAAGPAASPAAPAAPGGGRPPRSELLPPPLPDFTGRAAPLAELLTALDSPDGGWAVLCGPAGIGKSTLAVQAAHRLRTRYPDGRLTVRMRTEHGAARAWPAVLAELTRSLALPGPPADREEAAAEWRAWLAQHQVLLVLDDAFDEAGVRPLLPVAGGSSVLVTARSRLAGLEPAYRHEVPPFSPAEGLELLERLVGPERPRGDPEAARRIVAAAGGLPLGVRASGTKLAMLRHLPLAEYAARLECPGGPLDELAADGLAVRPRLAHAWRDLSAPARAALCALGRLPDASFGLPQAMAALRLGPEETHRALEPLIAACAVSIPDADVTAHQEIYQLPRLLHHFAREQSTQSASAP
jgi:DNA-binding SARP family transcriptional activator